MEVIVKVLSSYFEPDTSKYRLAISELTLIESLKQQSNRKFRVYAEMSAMDPCYTKRIKAFKSIKVPFSSSCDEPVLPEPPFIEVCVDDDLFLHADLIASLHTIGVPPHNRRLLAPNGYLYRREKLQPWIEKQDIVEINQVVQSGQAIRDEWVFTRSHVWIHVRHAHNNSLLMDKPTAANITGLDWPGWQQNIVEKYCQTRVAEASAFGCELDPYRSSSVIYAHNSGRGRRKK